MKKSALLRVFAFSLALASAASAGLPRPMVVFYGQACDRFGQVYRTGADVILMRGEVEVGRNSIDGSIAPGVNFAVRVPVDGDPADGGNYVEWAVSEGDELEVWISDSAGLRKVESCAVPPVGKPGSAVAIRVMAGEDSDGDGMLDAWERANGLDPNDPSDASLDPDGDGQPNLAEFESGTLPWLGSDVFAADSSVRTESGMFCLTFPTAYGKVYSVASAPLVLDETGNFAWAPCPFALADGDTPAVTRIEGTGDLVSIYLDASALSGLWRLEIE